jgi:serine/threonine-protein kinase
VLGTTDSVSPEQARGHDVTEQSDIYSLGIVLYEMLTGEVPFRADTQVAVAMKHVREPLPDVQVRRPEISAALASVVERATAKETLNRYTTVDDMVHDLEEVLGIEAARSGHATGEATTVLRTLPGDTADFVPERIRHPKRVLAISVLALALVAGAIFYFVGFRTEKGPGATVTPSRPGLSEVNLSGDAATDYDPEGDGEESSNQTQNAIDGSLTTNWDTETYQGGFEGSNKGGVGLYLDTGDPVSARELDLVTSTPGYTVKIHASNTVPGKLAGWDAVSGNTKVKENQRIQLDTAGQKFRYYLVWISTLPEGNKAKIQELGLKK